MNFQCSTILIIEASVHWDHNKDDEYNKERHTGMNYLSTVVRFIIIFKLGENVVVVGGEEQLVTNNQNKPTSLQGDSFLSSKIYIQRPTTWTWNRHTTTKIQTPESRRGKRHTIDALVEKHGSSLGELNFNLENLGLWNYQNLTLTWELWLWL